MLGNWTKRDYGRAMLKRMEFIDALLSYDSDSGFHAGILFGPKVA